MNKVILHGRVTQDPEIRYEGNETHTCYGRWSLAIEDKTYKEKDGKYHVNYIPCVGIGKIGELAQNYLSKGKEVIVVGKIQTGSYKNKDGKRVYTLEVVVSEIEFCGKKNETQYEGDFSHIPNGVEEELPFC
jgi:single-strand DNA-binding protein